MNDHISIFHQRRTVGETIAWSLQFASGYQAVYANSDAETKTIDPDSFVILTDACNLPKILQLPSTLNCPVILLIDDIENSEALDALDGRVAGILDLSKGPEKLIDKVHQILEHKSDDENILIQHLIHQKSGKSGNEGNDYGLTAREKMILKQLREGIHLKMVAHNTGTTYETVRTHVKHIYRKLGVTSASEAIIKAMKMDLD